MTDSRCIPIEELARVRALPEGAPERSHAESCPRCRAALLALAEFEREGGPLPAEAGAGRAHARLDGVIDSLTGEEPGRSAPAAAVPRREGPGWLARLLAPPALRFAGAFAALAIVAASAWVLSRGPAERLERGAPQASETAVVRATEGGWQVSWPAVAGADAYDVVFLSADLREVARVGDVRENRLTLQRDALPAGVTTGVPLLVEVDARSGGRILRMTDPAAVTLD